MSVNNKILEYEKFVNEVLRTDLNKVMKRHELISQKIANYLQVKSFIEHIKTTDKVKTQMDLGCNFYVQCVVQNNDRIMVDIGMGIYLEYNFDEALKFIDKKQTLLNEELNLLVNQAALIKANIKVVLQGLAELQGIPSEEEKPHRSIWD